MIWFGVLAPQTTTSRGKVIAKKAAEGAAILPGVADKARSLTMMPRVDDEIIYLVGLIVIHWAQLEFDLANVVADAAKVDYSISRLTFREPRASDQIDVVVDLLRVQNVDPPTELIALKAPIRAAEDDRNKLVHSTWIAWPKKGTTETELRIRSTIGRWEDKRQERFGMKGRVRKKVVAHAELVTAETCLALLERISGFQREVHALRHRIVTLGPSRPKHP